MANPSVIPMPVFLIIAIVLLAAVIYLTVRTASLGKRLQKLTQAFVNERHKVSQIVRYLNGDTGKFDEFGRQVAAQLDGSSDYQLQGQQRPQPRMQQHPQSPGQQRPQAQMQAQMQGQPNRVNPVAPARMAQDQPVGFSGVRPIGPAKGAPARKQQHNAYHEERERQNKRSFGRRNKPVIPFGADRTNEQRAARAAAAMIDDAPALSMDLSEPAAILRQQEMTGGMPLRDGRLADRPSMDRPRQPMKHTRAEERPIDRRPAGIDASRQDSNRRMPQGQDRTQNAMPRRSQGMEGRPFNGQGAPVSSMNGEGRRIEPMQQRQPIQARQPMPDAERRPFDQRDAAQRSGRPLQAEMQGRRIDQPQRRPMPQDGQVLQQQQRPVREAEPDPRVAQEKAAVSAAWIAEEQRRVEERQARQAAQAKRAERREQAHLRRQAEAIVQEHMRQTQTARANDTIRFEQ